jgi:hypothetical protein
MQARIADEMLTTAVTTAQIQNAILDAVQEYQEKRFWFTELRYGPKMLQDGSLAFYTDSNGSILTDSVPTYTVLNQEFYGITDWPILSSFSHIDKLAILAFSERWSLTPRTPQWMEDIAVSPVWNSVPTDWAYVGGTVRMYPIPNGAYAVYLTGTQIYAQLVNPSDTNPWTTVGQGERLVRLSAEATLFDVVDRNPQQADRLYGLAQRELDNMEKKTSQRGTPARIRGAGSF